ncbi:MAG: high-affinity nickel-transporter [Verrucomicrobiales bacterium]|nr:high-affinity nickel-transporter [Verrucomicrobiales bacterium]
MLTLVSILLLGFFLGMRHATDADHVIAVTTIVSRERTIRSAAVLGAIWGIGHSLTLLLVGGAIILFGIVIPPRLGLSLEFTVALMLVLLGLMNIRSFTNWLRERVCGPEGAKAECCHEHTHAHGDYAHAHFHGHRSGSHGHRVEQTPTAWLDLRFGGLNIYQAVRPLLVGVVHGLAGSAAVALLVLPIIQNAKWAVAYLLLFGCGTIAGMMLITAAVALPFACSAVYSAAFNRRLAFASCLMSIGFGLFLMYQIGFVQGLFVLIR